MESRGVCVQKWPRNYLLLSNIHDPVKKGNYDGFLEIMPSLLILLRNMNMIQKNIMIIPNVSNKNSQGRLILSRGHIIPYL